MIYFASVVKEAGGESVMDRGTCRAGGNWRWVSL
jgi:hypothetical protein